MASAGPILNTTWGSCLCHCLMILSSDASLTCLTLILVPHLVLHSSTRATSVEDRDRSPCGPWSLHQQAPSGNTAKANVSSDTPESVFSNSCITAEVLRCRLDVTGMMRQEAGVDVKVMGPQELPACALSNDRVLQ